MNQTTPLRKVEIPYGKRPMHVFDFQSMLRPEHVDATLSPLRAGQTPNYEGIFQPEYAKAFEEIRSDGGIWYPGKKGVGIAITSPYLLFDLEEALSQNGFPKVDERANIDPFNFTDFHTFNNTLADYGFIPVSYTTSNHKVRESAAWAIPNVVLVDSNQEEHRTQDATGFIIKSPVGMRYQDFSKRV